MRHELKRINRLLDDLMQAASPEIHITNLEIAEVDVREIIQLAILEVDQVRREKGIALQMDLPADIDWSV